MSPKRQTKRSVKAARRRIGKILRIPQEVRKAIANSPQSTNEELAQEHNLPIRLVKKLRYGTVYRSKRMNNKNLSKFFYVFLDNLTRQGFETKTIFSNIIVNDNIVVPLAPNWCARESAWRFKKVSKYKECDFYALVCDNENSFIVPAKDFPSDTRIPKSLRSKYKEYLNNYDILR